MAARLARRDGWVSDTDQPAPPPMLDALMVDAAYLMRQMADELTALQKSHEGLRAACEQLSAALLPFVQDGKDTPGRLINPWTLKPLTDDELMTVCVPVSAWRRAAELIGV